MHKYRRLSKTDRGHLDLAGGGHQADPQQGEHEPPLQARYSRGLSGRGKEVSCDDEEQKNELIFFLVTLMISEDLSIVRSGFEQLTVQRQNDLKVFLTG